MTQPDARTLSYLDRVQRVMTYIHDHLDEPLDLDRLCEVACMSRFHWHRIYKGITGETVAQTVRRLRLTRSSFALAQTNKPISEIAQQAGYSSQAAFSRAFSEAFKMPPAAFRKHGEHAKFYQANMEKDLMAFPMETRKIEATPGLAVVHKGPYPNIGSAFEKLFMSLSTEGLMDKVQGICGLYGDDPDTVAAEDLTSYACAMVKEGVTSSSLEPVTIGGGTYAVLKHKGDYTTIKPAYEWLFGTWLPQSGVEVRDGPCIEISLNSPAEVAPSELLTDICLPIEA